MHLIACHSRRAAAVAAAAISVAVGAGAGAGAAGAVALRCNMAICICLSSTVSSHVSGQRGHSLTGLTFAKVARFMCIFKWH